MIVAAGAAEGHAQEGAAEGFDLFVDEVHEEFHLVGFGEEFGADAEEAEGGEVAVALGGGGGGEEVAGDLFADELVVGEVAVEGVDDVVAVAPGIAEGDVFIEAVGVGVAGDIEPVAAPAFAVVRGIQEAVDDAGEGVGRVVGEEGGDVVGRGREAGEVEGGAAEEGAFVGGRGEGDSVGLELGEDEGVDGIAEGKGGGGEIFRGGDGGIGDGLEGPEFTAGFEIDFAFGDFGGGLVARIGRAHFHPLFEVADLVGGERAFGRHLAVAILVADGLDEAAFFRVAGDDGGAGFTAGEETVAGVEGEAAFEFLGVSAVAFVAAVDEDGADAFFEEVELLAGGFGGAGAGGGGDENQDQRDNSERGSG